MFIKELLEARIKCVIFALLVAATTVGNMLIALSMPNDHTPFEVYAWNNWFHTNAASILAVFAAVLGTNLISGEVSKGSIFFLLSKPITRDRVVLMKYMSSAMLMLLLALLGSLLIFIVGAATGHPLALLNILMTTLLLWLGTLFVLGLTLIFSVLFRDVLRPAIFALAITAVLLLPLVLPSWRNWSLISYWLNADTYFNGVFPLAGLLVNLLAAAVTLFIALLLFRKQAY